MEAASFGVRDMTLLSSALAMPESKFDAHYLHEDLFGMAAAYAFHLCQNHPFVDGNKRTALAAALVFLEVNGVTIEDPKGKLYRTVIAVASGRMKKTELRDALKNFA